MAPVRCITWKINYYYIIKLLFYYYIILNYPSVVYTLENPASLSACKCPHFMPTVVCPCVQLSLLWLSTKNLKMLLYGTSLPASASIRLTRQLYFPGQTLHRSGLPYGQTGPQISCKPSVRRALYVEPRVPMWSTDLADVAAVGSRSGIVTCLVNISPGTSA
jgi:hypothetical protein